MFAGFSSRFIEDDDYESDNSQRTNKSDNERKVISQCNAKVISQSDQPTAKRTKKSDPTNNRTRKFRDDWELKPEISKWLSRAKNDTTGTTEAFSKVCGCTIQARLATSSRAW